MVKNWPKPGIPRDLCTWGVREIFTVRTLPRLELGTSTKTYFDSSWLEKVGEYYIS